MTPMICDIADRLADLEAAEVAELVDGMRLDVHAVADFLDRVGDLDHLITHFRSRAEDLDAWRVQHRMGLADWIRSPRDDHGRFISPTALL